MPVTGTTRLTEDNRWQLEVWVPGDLARSEIVAHVMEWKLPGLEMYRGAFGGIAEIDASPPEQRAVVFVALVDETRWAQIKHQVEKHPKVVELRRITLFGSDDRR